MSATPRRISWTAERRASELVGRRHELLRRLPKENRLARALHRDIQELIIDDAIEFAAVHHDRDVATARDLELVFWSACHMRVRRARDGRHELVRGHYSNAGATALQGLTTDEDPAAHLQAEHDRALAHEFAATLDPHEQRVLKAKYDTDTNAPAGYKIVAQRLGLPIGAVRSAERSIQRKTERFAALYTAGRLCNLREHAITALADGSADDQQATVARMHVEHCAHCRPLYARQLRELATPAFERKVAALLPAAELPQRGRLRGAWDAITDTITRPFGHEGAATAAQLAGSGAGRGAGTVALLKLAGTCMASAGALGVCASTLIVPALTPDPPAKRTQQHPSEEGKVGQHDRLPARAEQHLTPTPASEKRERRRGHARTVGKTQGGTGPRDHERRPASPAPGNAAAGGASEFDELYIPDTGPAPAPVPAAPGSSEFF